MVKHEIAWAMKANPLISCFVQTVIVAVLRAVDTQANRLGGGNECRSSGFCMVLRFRGFGILSFGDKTNGW